MNFDFLQEELTRHPYSLLFMTLSGAHLYGFASPDSDYDLRGVHLLGYEQILGLQTNDETWIHTEKRSDLEIDTVTNDLKKFIQLMLSPNGYVLEQLYSPLVLRTSHEHEELKALGRSCLTRHHVHHYRGFAKNQWKLFTKEQPYKVKPLLYIYRVLLTGIYLMRTGEVEANLPTLLKHYPLPYLPDLIDQKKQGYEHAALKEVDFTFHEKEYNRLFQELDEAGQRTQLPEEPTARAALNDFLIRVRVGRIVPGNFLQAH